MDSSQGGRGEQEDSDFTSDRYRSETVICYLFEGLSLLIFWISLNKTSVGRNVSSPISQFSGLFFDMDMGVPQSWPK